MTEHLFLWNEKRAQFISIGKISLTEVSQVCNLLTSKELKGVKGVRGVKDNSAKGYQNPSIVMS
jgi:hypothetical protein